MDPVNIAISACVTIFSLGLLIITLISYNKSKNIKLLFVSIVFIILLVKGIILSLSIFVEDFENIITIPLIGFFDLIILLALFVATLKRK